MATSTSFTGVGADCAGQHGGDDMMMSDDNGRPTVQVKKNCVQNAGYENRGDVLI
jgi:hypothetical protein